MAYWLHDRGYDHRETEDCSTVVLTTDIGRYIAGTPLCAVLTSLADRMAWIEWNYNHGFSVATLAAFIAPYDPGTLGGSLLGVLGLDAVVLKTALPTFGLDAVLVSPTPATVAVSFGLNAILLEDVNC